MRYGSLCSGIEAASVAWSGLGWACQFFAEIDPFCSSLLACRWPTTPNLGDISTITKCPSIDLLVGGTPCQAFSVTGLRQGLQDGRGVLAFHFLRVAGLAAPRFVVWENVPGVLSSDDGRAFGSFLGGLEELGYEWAYRVLDARFFGGPHHRRRVFVVGHLGGRSGLAARVLFELEHAIQDPRQARKVRKTSAGRHGDTMRKRPTIYGGSGDETPKFVEDATPTLRASQGGEGNFIWGPIGRWRRRLTVREHERIMGFPDDYTLVEHKGKIASDRLRRKALGNSMDVRVVRWIGERITQSQEA